eukprot:TRINITY_DN33980_c0_g1_i1.p1 TRINITY_DN33980_c0_g1~~TRINITY_DN33980_c0_g1_i1.p1  ORF type:complete len:934 (-),score=212.75 TRINITY_DN33980_c0_g1_i1:82-2883(-)
MKKHVLRRPIDLKPWKEHLLLLDFYDDITEEDKDVPKEDRKKLPSVPLHFSNEQHYVDTFLPLYWEEAKMQIHRCKFTEMTHNPEEVEFGQFKIVDGFLKLEFVRAAAAIQTIKYMNGDLVVFTQGDDPVEEHRVHFGALIDNSYLTTLAVTARMHNSRDGGSERQHDRARAVAETIAARRPWKVAKVSNMSTMIREYEALMSMPTVPMRNILVNPDDSNLKADAGAEMQATPKMIGMGPEPVSTESGIAEAVKEDHRLFTIPTALQNVLEKRYNASQLQAITDSRKLTGVTLVQGPPGTGKTTTILGILSALLNSSAKSSKAVSYTRLKGTDALATSDEEEEESDREIEARKQERLKRIRHRAKYNQHGFLPWTDKLEQQLGMPGDARLRIPYQKINQAELRLMSEVEEDAAPRKVLVCAPSNAAIDEVLRRTVHDGIYDQDGLSKKPAIIRCGPNVHPSLEEYSLEAQAKRRVSARTERHDANQLEAEKEKLIRDARIVCATLSICGSKDIVGFPFEFDTVVVDEASQGVEVSMLIPLRLGCKRLIMVGDPQQLPATCFSSVAVAHHYDQSLFQRLQLSQHRVNMLQTQYRMHPAISSFPSKNFYNGLLSNVREKEDFEAMFPAAWSSINCFGPVTFFHLKGSHRTAQYGSLVNDDEADFVLQVYRALCDLYPEHDWKKKLAVISPYAEQVQLIRNRFRTYLGLKPKSQCPVDVNTVDGFQGREKDCVIVSVVRANIEDNSIGFVRDKRRMNVAFTRARLNLWVVGHADVLRKNRDWGGFIEQQEAASRLLRVSKPFDSFLGRYINDWYERKRLPKPDSKLLREAEIARARAEAEPEAEANEESDDAMSDVGNEGADYLRDVEEVSDNLGSEGEDDDSDDDKPLGPVEKQADSSKSATDQGAQQQSGELVTKEDGDDILVDGAVDEGECEL